MWRFLTVGIVVCMWPVQSSYARTVHEFPPKRVATYGDNIVQEQKEVDREEVRRVWLMWMNDARKTYGKNLQPYAYNSQLNDTAEAWSNLAKQRGAISHKRVGQRAYYDYPRMVQWFASQGLAFANVGGVTFSENIGWGRYACTSKNCTKDFLAALRSTFDFYLAERGKRDRPHWNSMMNPVFTQMGVGIAIDAENKKYYVTTHYGTEVLHIAQVPQQNEKRNATIK